jgi:hypothetical protein
MANLTSQHILSTSANLLGFCLFVITSIHVSNTATTSFIDEFTSVIAVLLILSCMFSFASIKTESPVKEKRLEQIADYLFILSLVGILIVVISIALNFIK